jgi:hypothetical protein
MYLNSGQLLEITNTLDVLIETWALAEENLRNDIASCYPDANEEFITQMFHGKYGAILSYASQCQHIENAFLRDLQKAFPKLSQELHQIATGLIAEITLHKKGTEKITGGDIGILIIRPNVHDYGHYLKISDYRRGLLCQAKLKNQKGKWGRFTERQSEVLPKRLSYLSLLLYSYSDNTRRSLNPFQWQLCDGVKFSEIQEWLKTDKFTKLVTSDQIIANLAYGNVGTDNDDIISSIISPSRNPVLIIRVTWPDGRRPGGPSSSVRIYSRQENYTKQQIQIRH